MLVIIFDEFSVIADVMLSRIASTLSLGVIGVELSFVLSVA